MIFGLFTGTRQVCWCSQVLFFRQYSWSSANGNGYLRKVVCYLVINAWRNEKFSHGCESSFDCLKRFIHQKFTIMKKAFVYGVAGLFLPWSITSITYSQTSTNQTELKARPSVEKIIPTSKQLDAAGKTEFNFRSEISSNAVRNFMKDYKYVTNAKWSKLCKGYYVVNFTVDSIKTRIVYDRAGHWKIPSGTILKTGCHRRFATWLKAPTTISTFIISSNPL